MGSISHRWACYKNRSRTVEEGRRRRNSVTVQIRKAFRFESLAKRRDIQDVKESCLEEGETRLSFLTRIRQTIGNSLHPDEQLDAMVSARNLFSTFGELPFEDFIQSDMLTAAVECLNPQNHPKLKLEAAWILTNIASGPSEYTQKVVEAGAVIPLMDLLTLSDLYICDQAVWALANIIGDGPQLRDYVISQGVIPKIIPLIEASKPVELIRNIGWFMVNLCRFKEAAPPKECREDLLRAIDMLLNVSDDLFVLSDTNWSIAYLNESESDCIDCVLESGIVPKIMHLLKHQEWQLQYATLRALGNILTGTDEQTLALLNLNIISYFPTLLSHKNLTIRRETMWAISNITAGPPEQVQLVIDMGLLPKVVSVIATGEFEARREAAWVAANIAARGTRDQVLALIHLGVIKPLCELLDCADVNLISILLDGLYNMILKTGDDWQYVADIVEIAGIDKIERLQTHSNEEIYKRSFKLIDTFFNDPVDNASPPSTQQELYKF